ncbi:hypothetical protein Gotur_018928 [Gossypium turneri]
MADQSPANQTPPSSSMQSLSIDSQPPSSSSTPQMSLEQKFKIIRSVGEECIQEDELLNLLNHKPEPICYDGFEPSGRMHIASIPIQRTKRAVKMEIDIVYPIVLSYATNVDAKPFRGKGKVKVVDE